MDKIDLEGLEKFEKAATSGPWTCDKPGKDADGFSKGVAVAATYGRQMIYADPPGGSFPAADQRFIAAIRNAAPALIKAARERNMYAELCAEWEKQLGQTRPSRVTDDQLFESNRAIAVERDAAWVELASLRSLLAKAEEAMEPFAEFAEALNDSVSSNSALGIFCNGGMNFGPSGGADLGNLRRVAAILSEIRKAKP